MKKTETIVVFKTASSSWWYGRIQGTALRIAMNQMGNKVVVVNKTLEAETLRTVKTKRKTIR